MAHSPSHYVSKYNGYIINGCRYHTKDRDELRTTESSGVSVVALTMQISSAKDKNLIFGELCFYGVIYEIGILITLCLGFQFSCVTRLTITTTLKLMNLGLH